MQNLKSKYEQQEMKVSDGLWDRLEEKLHQVPAKKKKSKVVWWRFVAVIILILNFGGISWMTDIKNKVKANPEFEFQKENQIATVKKQSENINEIQKSVSTNNSEIDNQRLVVENKDSSTPLRMTKKTRKDNKNLILDEEILIKKEEVPIPQPEEKLAQNNTNVPKQKVKYVSSSDLLFGVEIDKAKTETPKSAMGINTLKPKNDDSDFPNPKRVKLFGITLYDKDSITTK